MNMKYSTILSQVTRQMNSRQGTPTILPPTGSPQKGSNPALEAWGRATWTKWQNFAVVYNPTMAAQARMMMETDIRTAPCGSCLEHALPFVQNGGIDFSSKAGFARSLSVFHNIVNARIGKPQYNVDQFVAQVMAAGPQQQVLPGTTNTQPQALPPQPQQIFPLGMRPELPDATFGSPRNEYSNDPYGQMPDGVYMGTQGVPTPNQQGPTYRTPTMSGVLPEGFDMRSGVYEAGQIPNPVLIDDMSWLKGRIKQR